MVILVWIIAITILQKESPIRTSKIYNLNAQIHHKSDPVLISTLLQHKIFTVKIVLFSSKIQTKNSKEAHPQNLSIEI